MILLIFIVLALTFIVVCITCEDITRLKALTIVMIIMLADAMAMSTIIKSINHLETNLYKKKEKLESRIATQLDLGKELSENLIKDIEQYNDKAHEDYKTLHTLCWWLEFCIGNDFDNLFIDVDENLKRYCSDCGVAVGKDDKYCSHCGQEIVGKNNKE